jgi:hypothetical protein
MAHAAYVVWNTAKNPPSEAGYPCNPDMLVLNPGFRLKTEQIFNRNEYDGDQQRRREIHGFEVPYAQNV